MKVTWLSPTCGIKTHQIPRGFRLCRPQLRGFGVLFALKFSNKKPVVECQTNVLGTQFRRNTCMVVDNSFFLGGEMCNRRDNAGYHFWLPWLQFIGDVYSIGHTSNPATLAVSHVSLPRCWCPSLAKEPHVQDLNGGHVRAPWLWCPVAGYRHRCGPSSR